MIAGGAFALAFPQVREINVYKVKRVYIDVDADGLCDHARDRVFTDARAHLGSGELVVREPRSDASDEFPSGGDAERLRRAEHALARAVAREALVNRASALTAL